MDTVGIKAGVSRVNIHSAHFGKLGHSLVTIKFHYNKVSSHLQLTIFFCNIQVIYSNPNMRRTLNAKISNTMSNNSWNEARLVLAKYTVHTICFVRLQSSAPLQPFWFKLQKEFIHSSL
jgi:hypothetical protein